MNRRLYFQKKVKNIQIYWCDDLGLFAKLSENSLFSLKLFNATVSVCCLRVSVESDLTKFVELTKKSSLLTDRELNVVNDLSEAKSLFLIQKTIFKNRSTHFYSQHHYYYRIKSIVEAGIGDDNLAFVLTIGLSISTLGDNTHFILKILK